MKLHDILTENYYVTIVAIDGKHEEVFTNWADVDGYVKWQLGQSLASLGDYYRGDESFYSQSVVDAGRAMRIPDENGPRSLVISNRSIISEAATPAPSLTFDRITRAKNGSGVISGYLYTPTPDGNDEVETPVNVEFDYVIARGPNNDPDSPLAGPGNGDEVRVTRITTANGDVPVTDVNVDTDNLVELLYSHLGLSEAKNHLGEPEYRTYASWKRAIKAKYSNAKFEGDADIAQASADGKGVGEWDGAVGCIYKSKVTEDMKAVREGWESGPDEKEPREPNPDAWKDDPENRTTSKSKPTIKVGPGEYIDHKTKSIRDRKTGKVIRTFESLDTEKALNARLAKLKSDLAELNVTPGNQKEADAIDNLRDEIKDIEAKLSGRLNESDELRAAWNKWKQDVRAVCPDATFGPSARADGPVPKQQQAVWWNEDGNPEVGNWKDGKGEVYTDFEKRVKRVKEDVNLPKFKSSLAHEAYKQKLVDRG